MNDIKQRIREEHLKATGLTALPAEVDALYSLVQEAEQEQLKWALDKVERLKVMHPHPALDVPIKQINERLDSLSQAINDKGGERE
jgi:hypothetical protein